MTGAALSGAEAENWFSGGDACMDLDSVHLVNDAKVDRTIVAYQVSVCENDHPDKRIFLIGVRRDECPGILNGATSFGSYMREPSWPNWRKVDLSDESFRTLAFTACRRKGSPDGVVVFDNDLSRGDVTIYVDGAEVCQLDSAYERPFAHSECDVDLRRFGTDSQFRHAVAYRGGARRRERHRFHFRLPLELAVHQTVRHHGRQGPFRLHVARA